VPVSSSLTHLPWYFTGWIDSPISFGMALDEL
jgi:hypothetical protein